MSEHTAPIAVAVRNITKRFGDVVALDNVSLEIQRGEFFSLLGPSGCGKTTLLRIIAGLDFPDSGAVIIGGQDAVPIPAYRRPVNTVFQSYALFPHMTVRQNIGFGLRMKKIPRSELEGRVDHVMQTVQIKQLANRKPPALSGGQRQRVALARAIVNEPEVLLLDEPLGALDLKLRKELQVELLDLQRRLGITFICVTHDQEEALVMSDRIAVLNQGRVEQLGPCEELYEFPQTRFVSNFLGSSNLFNASVLNRNGQALRVETPIGQLDVKLPAECKDRAAGSQFTLAIRPEKVVVNQRTAEITGTENTIPGIVRHLIYIGSESHHVIDINGTLVTAEAMNNKLRCGGFDAGAEVFVRFPADSFVALSD